MSKATFFLHSVPEEDFKILADIIRDKGGWNCSLKEKNEYENYYNYVEATINELLDYGSNTFASQVDYNVLLKDVCKKLEVSYEKEADMGRALLEKIATSLFEKLSPEQKKEFIDMVLKDKNERENFYKEDAYLLFAALFKAGGFASYQLAVIIANNIATAILGRGLSLTANAVLTRALSFVSGPLALLMAAWTVKEIAGPAYRVTIPAVIYIEALRTIDSAKENGVLVL